MWRKITVTKAKGTKGRDCGGSATPSVSCKGEFSEMSEQKKNCKRVEQLSELKLITLYFDDPLYMLQKCLLFPQLTFN